MVKKNKLIKRLKWILNKCGYLDSSKTTESLIQEYIDELEYKHLTEEEK